MRRVYSQPARVTTLLSLCSTGCATRDAHAPRDQEFLAGRIQSPVDSPEGCSKGAASERITPPVPNPECGDPPGVRSSTRGRFESSCCVVPGTKEAKSVRISPLSSAKEETDTVPARTPSEGGLHASATDQASNLLPQRQEFPFRFCDPSRREGRNREP